MITLNIIISASFIAIISLAGLLLLISMIKITRIAEFLMDKVVELSGTISGVFLLTYFLAAIFFWLFDYGIIAYVIWGILLVLISLSLLLIIYNFGVILDLVYSDFFGFFVFVYIGSSVGLGIYFYLIDLMVPAFILPSAAIFYFGVMEMIILRKNFKEDEKKQEDVSFSDKLKWQTHDADLIGFLKVLSKEHSTYLLPIGEALDRFFELKIFKEHANWIPEEYKENPIKNYKEVTDVIIGYLKPEDENRIKVYQLLVAYKRQFDSEQIEILDLEDQLKEIADSLPDDFELKLNPQMKKLKKDIGKKKKGIGIDNIEDKPKQID